MRTLLTLLATAALLAMALATPAAADECPNGFALQGYTDPFNPETGGGANVWQTETPGVDRNGDGLFCLRVLITSDPLRGNHLRVFTVDNR